MKAAKKISQMNCIPLTAAALFAVGAFSGLNAFAGPNPPSPTATSPKPPETVATTTAEPKPKADKKYPAWKDISIEESKKYFVGGFNIYGSGKQPDGTSLGADLVGVTFSACVGDASTYKISNTLTDKDLKGVAKDSAASVQGFRVQLSGAAMKCAEDLIAAGKVCDEDNACVRLSHLENAHMDLNKIKADGPIGILVKPVGVDSDDYLATISPVMAKSQATRDGEKATAEKKAFDEYVASKRHDVANCVHSLDQLPLSRAALDALDSPIDPNHPGFHGPSQLKAGEFDKITSHLDDVEYDLLVKALNKDKIGDDSNELDALEKFADKHPRFTTKIAKLFTTRAGKYLDLAKKNNDLLLLGNPEHADDSGRVADDGDDSDSTSAFGSSAADLIRRAQKLPGISDASYDGAQRLLDHDLSHAKMQIMLAKGLANNPDGKSYIESKGNEEYKRKTTACAMKNVLQSQGQGQPSRVVQQVSDPDGCRQATADFSETQNIYGIGQAVDCYGMQGSAQQQAQQYPQYASQIQGQFQAQCGQILSRFGGSAAAPSTATPNPLDQSNNQPVGTIGPVGAGQQPPAQSPSMVNTARAPAMNGAAWGAVPARTGQVSRGSVDLNQSWGYGQNFSPAVNAFQIPNAAVNPFSQ